MGAIGGSTRYIFVKIVLCFQPAAGEKKHFEVLIVTEVMRVQPIYISEKHTMSFWLTAIAGTNFQIQVGKKLDRKMELWSLKNVLASDKINTFFGSDFPSCCLMTWQSSPDELLFETWVNNLFFFFLPAPVGGKTIFLKLFRSRLECFCGLSHVFQRVGRFRMT